MKDLFSICINDIDIDTYKIGPWGKPLSNIVNGKVINDKNNKEIVRDVPLIRVKGMYYELIRKGEKLLFIPYQRSKL